MHDKRLTDVVNNTAEVSATLKLNSEHAYVPQEIKGRDRYALVLRRRIFLTKILFTENREFNKLLQIKRQRRMKIIIIIMTNTIFFFGGDDLIKLIIFVRPI